MKRALISGILGALTLTGCMRHLDFSDFAGQEAQKEVLKPASEYFDFNTTDAVTVSVNYGAQGSGALLALYTEDPVLVGEDGEILYADDPLFSAFCDESGRYEGRVTLPTYVTKVYVYTSRTGLPQLLTAEVKNGRVELDVADITAGSQSRRAATRATTGLKVWKIPYIGDLYSIVDWEGERFGKIVDDQGLLSEGDFSKSDIDKIQQFMWQGKTKKPDCLDNSRFLTGTKTVNTTIPEQYVNEQGQTVQVTGAEVWMTFLSEGARYQDGIGYYYYPTVNPPKKGQHMNRYIAIPNTSVPGVAPFFLDVENGVEQERRYTTGYWNYKYSDAPFAANKRIQLLYHDEATGEVSTTFPPGYTIGYFLTYKYSNADTYNDATMKIENRFLYSNVEFNSDGKSRFMALGYKDKIIYGVEDGVDQSLEDVLFTIDANPKGVIVNEERPTIDMEELTATEVTYATYAYEDIWPQGGDYDLNDVVVEHQHKVTFNQRNYVTRIEDTFTPVQRGDAATYQDAFAIQIPADEEGVMTLPEGAFKEQETGSIFLFTHAMAVRNKPFTITRTFADGQLAKNAVTTDLNPFIVSQYNIVMAGVGRNEIHLPKHAPTSKVNMLNVGNVDDAYYINKDGKHPFAITIPFAAVNGSGQRFSIVSERASISQEYPRFDAWVESNGATDVDWYLYYQQ